MHWRLCWKGSSRLADTVMLNTPSLSFQRLRCRMQTDSATMASDYSALPYSAGLDWEKKSIHPCQMAFGQSSLNAEILESDKRRTKIGGERSKMYSLLLVGQHFFLYDTTTNALDFSIPVKRPPAHNGKQRPSVQSHRQRDHRRSFG